MNAIPEPYRKEVDAFPPLLRALLDSELAAGNAIAEVRHGFPAAPIGACVMLARPVATRPRKTGDGLSFRERNGNDYSGEFTDSDEFFYIIEPPLPPPPEPDMDAIRAAHENNIPERRSLKTDTQLVDRFRSSMQMDYEKWHDGIGYDTSLFSEATDDDKRTIMSLLTPPKGWREIEALAALDTDAARAALRKAMVSGDTEIKTAITRYASDIVDDRERTKLLVDALQHGAFYGGLTSALDQVAEFHPQPVIDALFRGLFVRPGDAACHYAAMLAYVYGKADSTFDWSKRPLFLRFNTDDGAERRKAFRALCKLLELDYKAVLLSLGDESD